MPAGNKSIDCAKIAPGAAEGNVAVRSHEVLRLVSSDTQTKTGKGVAPVY
jgi:hypothetical protein